MSKLKMRIQRLVRGEMSLEYSIYKLIGRKKVPNKKVAHLFKKVFKKDEINDDDNIGVIKVPTCDGFDQATHPDAVWFENRVFFVVTPYAYSDERLENPCLYECTTRGAIQMKRIGDNPLIKWDKREYRHHYSDPALLVDSDCLNVFYRDSLHLSAEKRIDKIYRIKSQDASIWTAPEEVSLPSEHFIAPSFCRQGDSIYVYYTEDFGEKTEFHLGLFKENKIEKLERLTVINAPLNMTIWHVDVKKYGADVYVGLFTYMEKAGHGRTKLYYAESKDMIKWEIQKELPEGKKVAEYSYYKATSIKINGNIIGVGSMMDSRQRWRICNLGVLK